MADGQTQREFWEERYAASVAVWSGRVNAVLGDIVAELEPGRALDLGCGEGGDAVWLARQGWQVTGVDVSSTAVGRARGAAAASGVADRTRFVVVDLADWQDEGGYDLVAASFLHSPVEFPRTEVLRRAAGSLSRGGHLLVVGHAALPPWADAPDGHEHSFLGPDEELAALSLEPAEWVPVLAETRPREATGPDGERATLEDAVLLVRRR